MRIVGVILALFLAGCVYGEAHEIAPDGRKFSAQIWMFCVDWKASKVMLDRRPTTQRVYLNGVESQVDSETAKAIADGVAAGIVEGLKH
jgi:hypothetical protein